MNIANANVKNYVSHFGNSLLAKKCTYLRYEAMAKIKLFLKYVKLHGQGH